MSQYEAAQDTYQTLKHELIERTNAKHSELQQQIAAARDAARKEHEALDEAYQRAIHETCDGYECEAVSAITDALTAWFRVGDRRSANTLVRTLEALQADARDKLEPASGGFHKAVFRAVALMSGASKSELGGLRRELEALRQDVDRALGEIHKSGFSPLAARSFDPVGAKMDVMRHERGLPSITV
ncbi:MAG: hypothetical protein RL701_2149 [Pseudomonadota bacterium]|jgi:hypothetical protein